MKRGNERWEREGTIREVRRKGRRKMGKDGWVRKKAIEEKGGDRMAKKDEDMRK